MTSQYEQTSINLTPSPSPIPAGIVSIAVLGPVGLDGPPGNIELGFSGSNSVDLRLASISFGISPDAAGSTLTDIEVRAFIDGILLGAAATIPTGTAAGAVVDLSGLGIPATTLPAGSLLTVVVDPDAGGGGQVVGRAFLSAELETL